MNQEKCLREEHLRVIVSALEQKMFTVAGTSGQEKVVCDNELNKT